MVIADPLSRYVVPAPPTAAELFARQLTLGLDPTALDEETAIMEGSFAEFSKGALRVFVPNDIIWSWPHDAICEHLQGVTEGQIKNLIINLPPRNLKSSLVSVCWNAWEWIRNPRLRYLFTAYHLDLSIRDNDYTRMLIKSDWYQRRWGHLYTLRREVDAKKLFENNMGGRRRASSVTSGNTGEGGERIVVDDPHNALEADSEKARLEVLTWWNRVMSSRVNNANAAKVITAQRVHHADLVGSVVDLMKKGGESYERLIIPMEYDPKLYIQIPRPEPKPVVTSVRDVEDEDEDEADLFGPLREDDLDDDDDDFIRSLPELPDDEPSLTFEIPLEDRPSGLIPSYTSIGWSDPRKRPGELMIPEQWPPEWVAQQKVTVEPYAFCNPGEAPVLMGDLSLKRIEDVRAGDTVMGFTKVGPNGAFSRRSLTPAKVKSVSVSVQPVVRMYLDSGREIRCTPNHKWFTGHSNHDRIHAEYAPAKVGTPLHRVCEIEFPELSPEDERLGGWLGGFFDADGSYVGRLTSFSQGNDRNAPLCRKLERTLDHFGLPWGVKQNPRRPWVNWYYLKGGLPTLQRFMQVAHPTKWRERMERSYDGLRHFVIGQERVIAIEPEGEETVYGLETETGNYVVWGFASSNSAQYQQAPSPTEGGRFKERYWRRYVLEHEWHRGLRPELIIVDSAYGEEGGDPTGVSVWGRMGGRLYVMFAIELEEDTPGLRRKLRDLHARWKVPFLVENKANGKALIQDLRRGSDDGSLPSLPVIPFSPDGLDKISRAHSVVNYVAGGMVYLPEGADWVFDWIEQHKRFPKGEHDDLVDTTAMAVTWLAKGTADIRDVIGKPIPTTYGADMAQSSASSSSGGYWSR